MTKNFPLEGDVRTLTDYFGEIVPPCVQVCMVLNRKDILFEQVQFLRSLKVRFRSLSSPRNHFLADLHL